MKRGRKKGTKNYDWQFSDKVLNSVLFKKQRLYSHLRLYPTADAVALYNKMIPRGSKI